MKIYEHLLSKDPIGAFMKMKDNYKRYFETAYSVKNKSIEAERKALLMGHRTKRIILSVA